jgi:hypothetical protein
LGDASEILKMAHCRAAPRPRGDPRVYRAADAPSTARSPKSASIAVDLEIYYRNLKPGGFMVCDDDHRAGCGDDGVARAVDKFMANGRDGRIFKLHSQLVMSKGTSA